MNKNDFQYFRHFLFSSYSVTYNGSAKRITFPDSYQGLPVTEIGLVTGGVDLLSDSPVVHVTIPESVTEISDGAFSKCPKLKKITIPKSVTKIGKGALPGATLQEICFADANGWSVTKNGKTIPVPAETLSDSKAAAKFYDINDGVWSKL